MSLLKPKAGSQGGVGRKHQPPLEEVEAVKEDLTYGRRDNYMRSAFNLEDDAGHWSKMKSDGLAICSKELPPARLSTESMIRQDLSLEKAKLLCYRGSRKWTQAFLWDYATVDWRKKYAYDLEYLQRKYPRTVMRRFVCSLFSHWNSESNFPGLTRGYADGRNLAEVLQQLSRDESEADSEADSEPKSVSQSAPAQDNRIFIKIDEDDEVTDPVEDYDTDLKESISNLNVRKTDQAATPIEDNMVQKEIFQKNQGSSELSWQRVMLRIRHVDSTKGRLDYLPLRMVCGPEPVSILNIDMNKVKKDLEEQGVIATNYKLSLEGLGMKVGWRQSNMIQLLTQWEYQRGADDYEVPLIIASIDPDGSNLTTKPRDRQSFKESSPLAPTEALDSSSNNTTETTRNIRTTNKRPRSNIEAQSLGEADPGSDSESNKRRRFTPIPDNYAVTQPDRMRKKNRVDKRWRGRGW